jgi:hypothetical protein
MLTDVALATVASSTDGYSVTENAGSHADHPVYKQALSRLRAKGMSPGKRKAVAAKACAKSSSCPDKKAMSNGHRKVVQLNSHVPGQPYRYKHGWIKLPGTKDEHVAHLVEHHNVSEAMLRGGNKTGSSRSISSLAKTHEAFHAPGKAEHTHSPTGATFEEQQAGLTDAKTEAMAQRLERGDITFEQAIGEIVGGRRTRRKKPSPADLLNANFRPGEGETLVGKPTPSARQREIAKIESAKKDNAVKKAYRDRLKASGVNPDTTAGMTSNATPSHSDLLRMRKEARAKFPQGHPERLKAERNVRKSRKASKASAPAAKSDTTFDQDAYDEARQSGATRDQAKLAARAGGDQGGTQSDFERHLGMVAGLKLGESKSIARGTVVRRSGGYDVTVGGSKRHYAEHADDATRALQSGKHRSSSTEVVHTPGEVHAAAVLHNNGHVKDMKLVELLAADTEFKRRADALGRTGQVSKSHKAVRDEMASRVATSREGRASGIADRTAKRAAFLNDLPGRDPQEKAELAVTKSLSELHDKSRYYGRVRVDPSSGSGYLVTINGERHHYALASDAAKAIVAGRHTGVGRPPVNKSVRNARRRSR